MINKCKTAGLISLVIILSACSSTSYQSQEATKEFRTDGQRSEWTGRFQIPDGEKFALGLSHNKNYLYVAISSIDLGFKRQLAMGGLTLWLDVKGGKRENLGIKFEGVIPENKRNNRSQRGQTDRDRMFELPEIFDGDLFLIVTDTKAGKSMGPADLLASANSIDETLFIEYQIPLAMLGDEFNMEKLGLGLESSIERPAMAGGRADGMRDGGQKGGRGGGMGGGGQRGGKSGGMSGGGPGGSPGSDMNNNDIEVWTKIIFTQ